MNKFSNITLGLASALVISGCSTKEKTINTHVEKFSSEISKIVSVNEKNNTIKINRSIELIGKNEFNFFREYFKVSETNDILLKVASIQSINNLKIDGIIGPDTLKVIYLNYYISEDIDDLPFDIAKRLEIYEDMEGYKKHEGKPSKYGRLYPTNVPDIFSKNYFYGIGKAENIPGTYINKSLTPLVKSNIDDPGIVTVLFNSRGKFIIVTYIDGELKLLSYTSPGNQYIKGGVKTSTGVYKTRKKEMYYISSAKDSISRTREGLKGAIMPYALHVNGGIFAHAGFVDGGRKSHGCIRLPILYAKGLYEIYNESGNMNWYIADN